MPGFITFFSYTAESLKAMIERPSEADTARKAYKAADCLILGKSPGRSDLSVRPPCENVNMASFSDYGAGGSAEIGDGEQVSERVTRFDAGWMGCDLLPMEFRRRMQAVGLGDIVEFVVFDPSAKEDLPSLARMMGHRILRTEAGEGGAIIVSVERAR